MAELASTSNIDIFLRVRPVPDLSKNVLLDVHDARVGFNIPKDVAAGYINNQREAYDFVFNGILPPESKQDEVFERICRPHVDVAMSGINSTIFAYGQTGSGKTFTITGGPERYADRGLIPRALSQIYKQISSRSDSMFTVHISYMEIYNSSAYDLLDPSRDIKELADLPSVTITEDDEGRYHMRNLSMHPAVTEEEALNLLFLGDTNRMIAETPMNLASSRSHCVFSVHLEARRAGESTVRRSKLNLVDLAGSERVGKSGIDGKSLAEAKYINASLHFLEQVIMGLQERAMGVPRSHIPYRNSLMTMVLRDSLGGNCKTSMIATVNLAPAYLDESISTCRFAQRVACVSNKISVNEETDPNVVIERLKQEIRDLKDELKLLQGGEDPRGPLTHDEKQRLRADIMSYVTDRSSEAALNVGGTMMMIRAAFEQFKQLLLEASGGAAPAIDHSLQSSGAGDSRTGAPSTIALPGPEPEATPNKGVLAMREENRKLRLQVQQRDNEINILVSMLKKRGGPIAAASAVGAVPPPAAAAAQGAACSAQAPDVAVAAGAQPRASVEEQQVALMSLDVLKDRNLAFELFRKSYRRNAAIEDNKADLKQKYGEAKSLAAKATECKTQMNALRQVVEQRRLQRSASAIADGAMGTAEADPMDPEEEAARTQMEELKHEYKATFDVLRERKAEIEHLQKLLEQSRQRMTKDFEQWFAVMRRQQTDQSAPAASTGPNAPAPAAAQRSASDSVAASTSAANASASWATAASHPGSQTNAPLQQSNFRPPLAKCGLHPGAGRYEAVSCSVSSSMSLPAGASVGSPEGGGLVGVALPNGSNDVPAAVLEAARPFLTGDAQADKDIIGFYLARSKILSGAA